MEDSAQRLYRLYRPDLPLAHWIREQAERVIVHVKDLAPLQAAGLTNVETLNHGGPQPGEVWVPL